MNHKIPQEFIEEVRHRAEIVDVISEHVALKRTGKNYQGLCPFHGEKTPSFHVNPDRQMFYCFGCHTGGNVITFLMKKEGLTFLEAVKVLASKVGMEIPEKELSPQEKIYQQRRNRFKELHDLTAKFYHDVLLNRPEGKAGLDYFTRRGVGIDTIKSFRLGYAPPLWDSLIKELGKKGVKAEELEEIGLAVKKIREEDGSTSYYDRFRGRVVFTILDTFGAPIAFGGRVLDDSLPKYLNSPETAFFHKGRNLYGLHIGVKGIRERGYSLLLEGYMDTIAVQKAGFLNAVASLGTALTKDQAKILKKYAERTIVGYDSDPAGVQAALRAGEILLDEGLRVEVLVLEGVKDPDEFLNRHTPEEFRRKMENAITFIEFKYKILIQENPPKSIPDKGALIRKLAPDILRTRSAVEREGYERFLSLQLGLTLEAVQLEINSMKEKSKESKGRSENFSSKKDISDKKRDTIEGNKTLRAEQTLLRLSIENPALKNKIREQLTEDFWRLQEHRTIFETYPEQNLDALIQNDAWYENIQKSLAQVYQLELDLRQEEKLLADCIASIKSTQNKETVEDLQATMIQLEKSGDIAGALALLQEIGERLKRGENDCR